MTSPIGSAVERLRYALTTGADAMHHDTCAVAILEYDTVNYDYDCDCGLDDARAAVDEVEGELAAALARAESAEQKLAAANARVEQAEIGWAELRTAFMWVSDYGASIRWTDELQWDVEFRDGDAVCIATDTDLIRAIGVARKMTGYPNPAPPAARLEDEPEEERGDEE